MAFIPCAAGLLGGCLTMGLGCVRIASKPCAHQSGAAKLADETPHATSVLSHFCPLISHCARVALACSAPSQQNAAPHCRQASQRPGRRVAEHHVHALLSTGQPNEEFAFVVVGQVSKIDVAQHHGGGALGLGRRHAPGVDDGDLAGRVAALPSLPYMKLRQFCGVGSLCQHGVGASAHWLDHVHQADCAGAAAWGRASHGFRRVVPTPMASDNFFPDWPRALKRQFVNRPLGQ
eukprot:gene24116-29170_t